MVLFKRKTVQYLPPPDLKSDEQEIWVIHETDEVFDSYDSYLNRIDFYRQKKFSAHITGVSHLDFFEALQQEIEASTEIDVAFPQPLREPILRHVQNSIVSRIDTLVDQTFDFFKEDFYPGESVICLLEHDAVLNAVPSRLTGKIRDKIKFSELRDEKGDVEREAQTRYSVSIADMPQDTMVDSKHILRDRKAFNKAILRAYLKQVLFRASWTGAPWQIRSDIAEAFQISQEIPPELTREAQLAARKAELAKKKFEADKSKPEKAFDQKLLPFKTKHNSAAGLELVRQVKEAYEIYVTSSDYIETDLNGLYDPNFVDWFKRRLEREQAEAEAAAQKPPPPVIKYPCEDLEIEPQSRVRPQLATLQLRHATKESHRDHIRPETVGYLLEVWNTCNVFVEVLLLDSFTFDDFVSALGDVEHDRRNTLLDEIHCSLLKQMVHSEAEGGKVQLPYAHLSADEPEELEIKEETSPSAQPEEQRMTTRRSLAKSDELLNEPVHRVHRGDQIDALVKGYNWRARLQKRDLNEGKWILILIGLLNQLSQVKKYKDICEDSLSDLAPLQGEVDEISPLFYYSSAPIGIKVQILHLLCLISMDLPSMKAYMETCSKSSTEFRKEKVEWQKKRKQWLVDLKELQIERRTLQPEQTAAEEIEELELAADTTKDIEADEEDENSDQDSDDEPIPARSLRHANDRAAERKRRRDEDKAKKEAAEIEKARKPSKEAKQLEKVLKRIEDIRADLAKCEQEIAVVDEDLRQADCSRTRCLGRDRFWNRYYWFERNAMPFEGMPESSTASSKYCNGRLWVQGPMELEREGFLRLPPSDEKKYREAFGMDVIERKELEEAGSCLWDASNWGYYETPEQLSQLMDYLDSRGSREIKLRKEIALYRDKIEASMRARQVYQALDFEGVNDTKQSTGFLPGAKPKSRNPPKTWLDWTNLDCIGKLGHIHSIQPRARRAATKAATAIAADVDTSNVIYGTARTGTRGKRKAIVLEADPDEDEEADEPARGRSTRVRNKERGKVMKAQQEAETSTTGKKIGRQGTRYSW